MNNQLDAMIAEYLDNLRAWADQIAQLTSEITTQVAEITDNINDLKS